MNWRGGPEESRAGAVGGRLQEDARCNSALWCHCFSAHTELPQRQPARGWCWPFVAVVVLRYYQGLPNVGLLLR